ncbi:MAG: hypothetical protein WCT07_00615 [Candidatus Paceibacterota bacterium]|jgi:hypothetical protein
MVKKLTKVDPEKYDKIDKAVALAVMTSSAADKKETVGVTIQSLLEDVISCLDNIIVTLQELRHRLESWVKHGWGTMTNNIFLPNKTGRYHIGKMAEVA